MAFVVVGWPQSPETYIQFKQQRPSGLVNTGRLIEDKCEDTQYGHLCDFSIQRYMEDQDQFVDLFRFEKYGAVIGVLETPEVTDDVGASGVQINRGVFDNQYYQPPWGSFNDGFQSSLALSSNLVLDGITQNIDLNLFPGEINASYMEDGGIRHSFKLTPHRLTITDNTAETAGETIIEGGYIETGTIKTTTWNIPPADYVFEPDYYLAPLNKVESYVRENKHLPEVPSGKEMQEKGIDLAAMNMLLLKKVEELTLYTIEQDRRLQKLEQALEK